jgi:hypothetical protein
MRRRIFNLSRILALPRKLTICRHCILAFLKFLPGMLMALGTQCRRLHHFCSSPRCTCRLWLMCCLRARSRMPGTRCTDSSSSIACRTNAQHTTDRQTDTGRSGLEMQPE